MSTGDERLEAHISTTMVVVPRPLREHVRGFAGGTRREWTGCVAFPRLFLVVFLTALASATPARADRSIEWIGAELSAPGIGIAGRNEQHNIGAGLTVRLASVHFVSTYWTIASAGLGLFISENDFDTVDVGASHAFVATEFGVRRRPRRALILDVGLAAGLGAVVVPLKETQDGDSAGGVGVVFIPTVRLLHESRSRVTIGASLRLIVPTRPADGGLSPLLLLSLDVGLGAR